MTEILNMHIIKERLNVDKIRQKNANMVSTNSNIINTVTNLTFFFVLNQIDCSGTHDK